MARHRSAGAQRKLRLSVPGWRSGTFRKRCGRVPDRTYDSYRSLVQQAYRDGYHDVLDALADGGVTLAEAARLKSEVGLLGLRHHLAEQAARKAEKEATSKAESNIDEWMEEFRLEQPRRWAGRQVSEAQHLSILRGVGSFLDWLAEHHDLIGREAVTTELWTVENLRSFGAHYVATRCAAAEVRLRAKWQQMTNPPEAVEQKEFLRRERGKKTNSANHIVNAVSAYSEWLLSCDPPRISANPAGAVRISSGAASQHQADDHRSLTPAQVAGLRKYAALFDGEGGSTASLRGGVRPDALWFDMLLLTGATTYTEGTRLTKGDILIAEQMDGMVPIRLRGSKAETRKRTVSVPLALAERLLARAEKLGRDRAIFPIDYKTGSEAWAELMAFIGERDPALAAELEGVTPYALRHTFAVTALRSGVDLHQLMRLMGHRLIATTAIYLRHAQPPRAALSHMARTLGYE
jgi:integrase